MHIAPPNRSTRKSSAPPPGSCPTRHPALRGERNAEIIDAHSEREQTRKSVQRGSGHTERERWQESHARPPARSQAGRAWDDKDLPDICPADSATNVYLSVP